MKSLLLFALSLSAFAQETGRPSFSFIMHVTDPQATFLNHSETPGSLAVPGTEKTVKNIVDAASAARKTGLGRISVSGDAHFDIEVEDATQNGEFHGEYAFPVHGMKDRVGPEGDALISELDKVFPKKIRFEFRIMRS